MKTTIPFLKAVLTLYVSLTIFACADKSKGYVDIDTDQQELMLSGSNPRTVDFIASGQWYARIIYSQGDTIKWLNVTPLTGAEGANTITVTAKSSNFTGKDRTARVEIKLPAGNAGIVTVTQTAVEKPRFLQTFKRTMSGGTLNGPSDLSFEYTPTTEKIKAFYAGAGKQASKYELAASGKAIKVTVQGNESEIPIKLIGERISSIGDIVWEIKDIYTGVTLDRSTVRFEFNYDNSDDKMLQRISRFETVEVRDGETLPSPITIDESYQYKYKAIRMDSLIHISKYTYTSTTPATELSDTVKYSLKYPESYDAAEDNNMTADVWNMLVFPELQGTPFNSITGFCMLGLTGNMQPNFPTEATIESAIHSIEGLQREWPSQYLYNYQRNAAKEIESATVDLSYPSSTSRVTTNFTYSATIPIEEETKPEE